jgi:uncharacterized protein YacL
MRSSKIISPNLEVLNLQFLLDSWPSLRRQIPNRGLGTLAKVEELQIANCKLQIERLYG